jgi:hypothetical protein
VASEANVGDLIHEKDPRKNVALELMGDVLLVGCAEQSFAGQRRDGLAALNAKTGRPLSRTFPPARFRAARLSPSSASPKCRRPRLPRMLSSDTRRSNENEADSNRADRAASSLPKIRRNANRHKARADGSWRSYEQEGLIRRSRSSGLCDSMITSRIRRPAGTAIQGRSVRRGTRGA